MAGSGIGEAHHELDAYKNALDRHTIVAATDRGGAIVHVNDLFCDISGYSRSELIGAKHSIVNSGRHSKGFFAQMWRDIVRGKPWRGEICNRAKHGALYWVDTTIAPQRDDSGKVVGFVSIRYDITARKQAELALNAENAGRRKAEALLRDLFEAIPDGLVAFDENDRLTHFNAAYKEFHALTAPAIAEGASFASILEYAIAHGQYAGVGADPEARRAALRLAMARRRNSDHPNVHQLSDGRWLQVQERRSKSGHTVAVCTDISEIKRAEETIKAQAERDPLTGLFNRSVLLRRLANALSGRRRRAGALVLIDLDDFKQVNDTLGHDAGDRLLTAFAGRLAGALGKADTLARIGGDEFAIVLSDVTSAGEAEAILGKLVQRVGEPIALGRRIVSASCSLGVTFFPSDARTPKDLLKNADIAMYQAKARGRGHWSFFDSSLRARIERRQAMGSALRDALANGKIEIAVQPQFAFTGRRLTGFEGLARWKSQGQLVPPSEFIPIAEETGLIVPLGHQVMDKCLAFARSVIEEGGDPGRIAVNVAAMQLKQADFVAHVEALLARYAMAPTALEIEVTENVLLDRAGDRIAQSLQRLHDIGVAIALDDFGTGYASLAHLRGFPVDRVKIDRSFVHEIDSRSQDAIIVRAIINLAHNLGIAVVAEGIETPAQFEFLRDQGCDVAQGYLIGRPVSPEAAKALVVADSPFPAPKRRSPGRPTLAA